MKAKQQTQTSITRPVAHAVVTRPRKGKPKPVAIATAVPLTTATPSNEKKGLFPSLLGKTKSSSKNATKLMPFSTRTVLPPVTKVSVPEEEQSKISSLSDPEGIIYQLDPHNDARRGMMKVSTAQAAVKQYSSNAKLPKAIKKGPNARANQGNNNNTEETIQAQSLMPAPKKILELNQGIQLSAPSPITLDRVVIQQKQEQSAAALRTIAADKARVPTDTTKMQWSVVEPLTQKSDTEARNKDAEAGDQHQTGSSEINARSSHGQGATAESSQTRRKNEQSGENLRSPSSQVKQSESTSVDTKRREEKSKKIPFDKVKALLNRMGTSTNASLTSTLPSVVTTGTKKTAVASLATDGGSKTRQVIASPDQEDDDLSAASECESSVRRNTGSSITQMHSQLTEPTARDPSPVHSMFPRVAFPPIQSPPRLSQKRVGSESKKQTAPDAPLDQQRVPVDAPDVMLPDEIKPDADGVTLEDDEWILQETVSAMADVSVNATVDSVASSRLPWTRKSTAPAQAEVFSSPLKCVEEREDESTSRVGKLEKVGSFESGINRANDDPSFNAKNLYPDNFKNRKQDPQEKKPLSVDVKGIDGLPDVINVMSPVGDNNQGGEKLHVSNPFDDDPYDRPYENSLELILPKSFDEEDMVGEDGSVNRNSLDERKVLKISNLFEDSTTSVSEGVQGQETMVAFIETGENFDEVTGPSKASQVNRERTARSFTRPAGAFEPPSSFKNLSQTDGVEDSEAEPKKSLKYSVTTMSIPVRKEDVDESSPVRKCDASGIVATEGGLRKVETASPESEAGLPIPAVDAAAMMAALELSLSPSSSKRAEKRTRPSQTNNGKNQLAAAPLMESPRFTNSPRVKAGKSMRDAVTRKAERLAKLYHANKGEQNLRARNDENWVDRLPREIALSSDEQISDLDQSLRHFPMREIHADGSIDVSALDPTRDDGTISSREEPDRYARSLESPDKYAPLLTPLPPLHPREQRRSVTLSSPLDARKALADSLSEDRVTWSIEGEESEDTGQVAVEVMLNTCSQTPLGKLLVNEMSKPWSSGEFPNDAERILHASIAEQCQQCSSPRSATVKATPKIKNTNARPSAYFFPEGGNSKSKVHELSESQNHRQADDSDDEFEKLLQFEIDGQNFRSDAPKSPDPEGRDAASTIIQRSSVGEENVMIVRKTSSNGFINENGDRYFVAEGMNAADNDGANGHAQMKDKIDEGGRDSEHVVSNGDDSLSNDGASNNLAVFESDGVPKMDSMDFAGNAKGVKGAISGSTASLEMNVNIQVGRSRGESLSFESSHTKTTPGTSEYLKENTSGAETSFFESKVLASLSDDSLDDGRSDKYATPGDLSAPSPHQPTASNSLATEGRDDEANLMSSILTFGHSFFSFSPMNQGESNEPNNSSGVKLKSIVEVKTKKEHIEGIEKVGMGANEYSDDQIQLTEVDPLPANACISGSRSESTISGKMDTSTLSSNTDTFSFINEKVVENLEAIDEEYDESPEKLAPDQVIDLTGFSSFDDTDTKQDTGSLWRSEEAKSHSIISGQHESISCTRRSRKQEAVEVKTGSRNQDCEILEPLIVVPGHDVEIATSTVETLEIDIVSQTSDTQSQLELRSRDFSSFDTLKIRNTRSRLNASKSDTFSPALSAVSEAFDKYAVDQDTPDGDDYNDFDGDELRGMENESELAACEESDGERKDDILVPTTNEENKDVTNCCASIGGQLDCIENVNEKVASEIENSDIDLQLAIEVEKNKNAQTDPCRPACEVGLIEETVVCVNDAEVNKLCDIGKQQDLSTSSSSLDPETTILQKTGQLSVQVVENSEEREGIEVVSSSSEEDLQMSQDASDDANPLVLGISEDQNMKHASPERLDTSVDPTIQTCPSECQPCVRTMAENTDDVILNLTNNLSDVEDTYRSVPSESDDEDKEEHVVIEPPIRLSEANVIENEEDSISRRKSTNHDGLPPLNGSRPGQKMTGVRKAPSPEEIPLLQSSHKQARKVRRKGQGLKSSESSASRVNEATSTGLLASFLCRFPGVSSQHSDAVNQQKGGLTDVSKSGRTGNDLLDFLCDNAETVLCGQTSDTIENKSMVKVFGCHARSDGKVTSDRRNEEAGFDMLAKEKKRSPQAFDDNRETRHRSYINDKTFASHDESDYSMEPARSEIGETEEDLNEAQVGDAQTNQGGNDPLQDIYKELGEIYKEVQHRKQALTSSASRSSSNKTEDSTSLTVGVESVPTTNQAQGHAIAGPRPELRSQQQQIAYEKLLALKGAKVSVDKSALGDKRVFPEAPTHHQEKRFWTSGRHRPPVPEDVNLSQNLGDNFMVSAQEKTKTNFSRDDGAGLCSAASNSWDMTTVSDGRSPKICLKKPMFGPTPEELISHRKSSGPHVWLGQDLQAPRVIKVVEGRDISVSKIDILDSSGIESVEPITIAFGRFVESEDQLSAGHLSTRPVGGKECYRSLPIVDGNVVTKDHQVSLDGNLAKQKNHLTSCPSGDVAGDVTSTADRPDFEPSAEQTNTDASPLSLKAPQFELPTKLQDCESSVRSNETGPITHYQGDSEVGDSSEMPYARAPAEAIGQQSSIIRHLSQSSESYKKSRVDRILESVSSPRQVDQTIPHNSPSGEGAQSSQKHTSYEEKMTLSGMIVLKGEDVSKVAPDMIIVPGYAPSSADSIDADDVVQVARGADSICAKDLAGATLVVGSVVTTGHDQPILAGSISTAVAQEATTPADPPGHLEVTTLPSSTCDDRSLSFVISEDECQNEASLSKMSSCDGMGSPAEAQRSTHVSADKTTTPVKAELPQPQSQVVRESSTVPQTNDSSAEKSKGAPRVVPIETESNLGTSWGMLFCGSDSPSDLMSRFKIVSKSEGHHSQHDVAAANQANDGNSIWADSDAVIHSMQDTVRSVVPQLSPCGSNYPQNDVVTKDDLERRLLIHEETMRRKLAGTSRSVFTDNETVSQSEGMSSASRLPRRSRDESSGENELARRNTSTCTRSKNQNISGDEKTAWDPSSIESESGRTPIVPKVIALKTDINCYEGRGVPMEIEVLDGEMETGVGKSSSNIVNIERSNLDEHIDDTSSAKNSYRYVARFGSISGEKDLGSPPKHGFASTSSVFSEDQLRSRFDHSYRDEANAVALHEVDDSQSESDNESSLLLALTRSEAELTSEAPLTMQVLTSSDQNLTELNLTEKTSFMSRVERARALALSPKNTSSNSGTSGKVSSPEKSLVQAQSPRSINIHTRSNASRSSGSDKYPNSIAVTSPRKEFTRSPRLQTVLDRLRERRKQSYSTGSSRSGDADINDVDHVDVDDLFSRYDNIVKHMVVLDDDRLMKAHEKQQQTFERAPKNLAKQSEVFSRRSLTRKENDVIDVTEFVDLSRSSRHASVRGSAAPKRSRSIQPKRNTPNTGSLRRASSFGSENSTPSQKARDLRKQLDLALKASAKIRNTQERLGAELTTFKTRIQQQRDLSPASSRASPRSISLRSPQSPRSLHNSSSMSGQSPSLSDTNRAFVSKVPVVSDRTVVSGEQASHKSQSNTLPIPSEVSHSGKSKPSRSSVSETGRTSDGDDPSPAFTNAAEEVDHQLLRKSRSRPDSPCEIPGKDISVTPLTVSDCAGSPKGKNVNQVNGSATGSSSHKLGTPPSTGSPPTTPNKVKSHGPNIGDPGARDRKLVHQREAAVARDALNVALMDVEVDTSDEEEEDANKICQVTSSNSYTSEDEVKMMHLQSILHGLRNAEERKNQSEAGMK